MAVRFDDNRRSVTLSVHDVIDGGTPSGHLVLEVVQSRTARMAAGRAVHTAYQTERGQAGVGFRAEVTLKQDLQVGGWSVTLVGRVDGLVQEGHHTVVEEIKSTALDASRLYETDLDHWPGYASQLEVYVWMLANEGYPSPLGRLVLVSLADGARHMLLVPLAMSRIGTFIRRQILQIVQAHERRLTWLGLRRLMSVPQPFSDWRRGQSDITGGVEAALEKGKQLLVEAPTGLGKTAAILHGALRWALRKDKQIFWATSRNTQQVGVERTLDRFRERGVPLRSVTLRAREKGCLNEVVSCRPDACRYAAGYYDKIAEADLVAVLLEEGRLTPERLEKAGKAHEVCPVQLSQDLSAHVDVVIGDYNYAFGPTTHIRPHLGDEAGSWIVVADEIHQLVDRGREYFSPRVEAALARDAAGAMLASPVTEYDPFVRLAQDVERVIRDVIRATPPPFQDGLARAELAVAPWRRLAAALDDLGLDYALLKARAPLFPPGEDDPWLDTARSVLRFAQALEEAGEESVALVGVEPGREHVGLLCRDPSTWLGPHVARFAGFIGASATITPPEFYRSLLGLKHDLDIVRVPSPFPEGNRRVLVAPQVSTSWRDRRAHAPATADLIAECIEATPGNSAVYFPSFAMLRDIAGRWTMPDREVLLQEPGMTERRRRRWLDRLDEEGPPVVLAAVLGGVFAEGIDLPEGALSSVIICGPALPPVGLERDLLREYYEEHHGMGFRYASLVPGMTKVVQAAGRLIRRPEDRGVILLVGRRFRWRDYTSLLPSDWDVRVAEDPRGAVAAFWRGE